MLKSILVICTGNICRSPIAERLLRCQLPTIKIDSAGTQAMVGRPAAPSADKISSNYAVSLASHQARQFTREIARDYDLILVMEKEHIKQVTKIAPEARGKTLLITHWNDGKDITDPYQKGMEAFDFVYQRILNATHEWTKKLAF